MSTRLRFAAPILASLAGVLLAPSLSFAQAQCTAGWKCGVAYGGSIVMDLYVPTQVDALPGIVVSLHYCGGNSSNARSWFQSLADKYGFIIIAPSAGGSCFDASPQRSGERAAVASMVQYVITQNHADPTKVFAAGASSGACMANALLAAYPDVFAGGSVLAGVPAGAWTGGNAYGWTTPATRTAQEWGELVRTADAGFSGTRPRVQLWHGKGDTTLTYSPNFAAEVAQWTNVFGVTDANGTKQNIKPTGAQDNWDRTSYKGASGAVVLETNSSVDGSVPHDLSGRGLWPDVVRFFGLDQDTTVGGGTSTGGTGGASGGVGNGGSGGGSAGKGGSATSGGNATTGGSSGGATSSGGSASGGGPSSGGASSGGASSGGASSGGSVDSGGVQSGGVPGGGALGSGGAATGGSQTGGVSSGGSLTSSGGVATGGVQSSGGVTSVAGAPGATGGSSTAGAGGAPSSDGSCGCRVAGGTDKPGLGGLFGVTLALGLLARRRRSQR